jgi:hypothetical protein
MTTYTSHYPVAQNGTYVKTTSAISGHDQFLATDPSKSLTGTNEGNQWDTNNQWGSVKHNIDHGTPFVAARVYIENSHISGGYTNRGVKNILIYGTDSATAFANTTYADTTDLTLLLTIEVAQHVASNVADPQYFLITGNTTAFRYTVTRVVDSWGDAYVGLRRIEIQSEDAPATAIRGIVVQNYLLEGSLRVLNEQPYSLTIAMRNLCDQIYGLKMLVVLEQHYGDVPQVREILDQYYGAATLLRRLNVQKYGDALQLRQTLDQEWNMPGALRAIMEQRYHIAGGEIRSLADQVYDLKLYNMLRQKLEQVYVMAPGSALVQRPEISVTADGVDILGSCIHISGEFDEAESAAKFEIHLSDQAAFLLCRHLETTVVVTVDADTYTLLVEGPYRSRPSVGKSSYIVPLSSPFIVLDAPYAQTMTEELPAGLASDLVSWLALTADIAVDWRMVDEFKPAGTIPAVGNTPLSIIRSIVESMGGIVQPDPDGSIICRAEYPDPVPTWAMATPPFYLTDQDNFFSCDPSPDIRDGWNVFVIGNEDNAETGLILQEVKISGTKKQINVYQVPFDTGVTIALDHSGGTWVGQEAFGVVEQQLTEQVEIVGGEGNTDHPIYAINARAYKQDNLGDITPSESGAVRTELAENTLVDITYTTKYRKFIATDQHIEDVQFWPVPLEGVA